MNRYAGIGRRSAPKAVCAAASDFARKQERLGLTLVSGGALGMDRAFDAGVTDAANKEIYKSGKAQPWANDELRLCLPYYLRDINKLSPAIRATLARNMQIILGKEGNTPADFVICYTDVVNEGGTAYGLRCAKRNRIPIFNMYRLGVMSRVHEYLEPKWDDTPFLDFIAEACPALKLVEFDEITVI